MHKYYLVAAELARVQGDLLNAMIFYKKSIELAKQNNYVNEVALANELAAKFYLAEDNETVAKGFMMDAYYNYTNWGSGAKLQNLEKNHPQLLVEGSKLTSNLNTTSTTII